MQQKHSSYLVDPESGRRVGQLTKQRRRKSVVESENALTLDNVHSWPEKRNKLDSVRAFYNYS